MRKLSYGMEMIRAGEVGRTTTISSRRLTSCLNGGDANPEHIALSITELPLRQRQNAEIHSDYPCVPLEKFNLTSLASITQTDEMELWSIGEKKTAVFAVTRTTIRALTSLSVCCIPSYSNSFTIRRHYPRRSCPPCAFIMDEFANVALPDEFDKLLSTMRSREISVSIIIQNLAQLKALFEKQWESIVGNCDEFLYLGGNEQSTTSMFQSYWVRKQSTPTPTDNREAETGATLQTGSLQARADDP
jgi:type IV secretion system protein VirD4